MNSNRVHKNVESKTKWTNAILKTYEEAIRGGSNRSIKAQLVTAGGDDDDDDDDAYHGSD
jgi:hypothetical protein